MTKPNGHNRPSGPIPAASSAAFELEQLTPEQVHEILAERARVLARPTSSRLTGQLTQSHVRFSTGGVDFAVELAVSRQIIRPAWMTEIPGAPSYLADVIHLDGRIVSVLDLCTWLDLPDRSRAESERVLLLESGGRMLGIFASHLSGAVALDTRELAPPPHTTAEHASGCVRGLTADMTVVLDGARLIATARVDTGGLP